MALAVAGVAAGAIAAAPAPGPGEFRVCADPNNLPFSNRAGEGFENEIAELFARDLGASVRYEWYPQSRGFARKTLKAGSCDVIMGVPAKYDPVRTTKPYYRTTYVFVYPADRGWHITSFDDPVLKRAKIGVHLIMEGENSPAAEALARRGMIDNVVGYRMVDDYARPNPPSHIVDAVARGDIDVAVVWGPIAGYFAPREPVRLAITPVRPSVDSLTGIPFAYDIAMGVRPNDRARAALLDSLIDREQPAIRRILDRYGVPRGAPHDSAMSRSRTKY